MDYKIIKLNCKTILSNQSIEIAKDFLLSKSYMHP